MVLLLILSSENLELGRNFEVGIWFKVQILDKVNNDKVCKLSSIRCH